MPKQNYYSELQLVAAIKLKDQDAFSYLYDHYCEALSGMISRVVGPANSEDLLQDVFIKIWNCFDKYDPAKSTLFTWMAAIARNTCIDSTRSKVHKLSKKTVLDERILQQLSDHVHHNFDHLGIAKHLQTLKPIERKIILLAYYNGYTHVEIAVHTGIPVGTVKTKIRHSITKLKMVFKESYERAA